MLPLQGLARGDGFLQIVAKWLLLELNNQLTALNQILRVLGTRSVMGESPHDASARDPFRFRLLKSAQ